MASEAENPLSAELELDMKLEGIFMPQARKQRDAYGEQAASGAVPASLRFVHYTSADAALKIIRSKRVWMRNTKCMSDYREVQHGFDMIAKFFADEPKKAQFIGALDMCAPGAAAEAIRRFNYWWTDIRLNTYIASISEHDTREDSHGRLSMWRAFGGDPTRVAIVLNIPWFAGGGDALHLIFSPVSYLTEDQTHAVIYEVIDNISKNCDFLRSLERERVIDTVFTMLLAGVTCLKHEGFREEQEWRAIYSPNRWPSDLMERCTQVIGGIPQVIYKMPLDVKVSQALADLEFSRIFDRLIIGPSSQQYSWPMVDAFGTALTEAGVQFEPEKKRIFISGIPIRS